MTIKNKSHSRSFPSRERSPASRDLSWIVTLFECCKNKREFRKNNDSVCWAPLCIPQERHRGCCFPLLLLVAILVRKSCSAWVVLASKGSNPFFFWEIIMIAQIFVFFYLMFINNSFLKRALRFIYFFQCFQNAENEHYKPLSNPK